MSLATLRAEVAECRAWERRLHGGSPSMRVSAALPGRAEWLLPLFMPVSAFTGTRLGWDQGNQIWFAIIPWFWLVSFGRIDPPSVPGEWEALRLPSRRAWLLSRWSLRLLPLLWLGVCTVAWLVLWGRVREEKGVPAPPALVTVLLAPYLAVALVAWMRIQAATLGGRRVLLPLVAAGLTLAGAVGMVALFAIGLRDHKAKLLVFAAAVPGAATLLFFLLGLPSWREIARAAGAGRAGRGLGRFARLTAVGLSGIAVLAGSLVLALSGNRLLPVSWDSADRMLLWIAPGLVAVVLAALTTDALSLLVRADVGVEAAATPAAFAPASRVSVPLTGALVPRPRRSSLVAAAWALYRGRWRNLQHPRLLFLPKFLWDCRAPACGFLGVMVPAMLAHDMSLTGILRLFWPAILLLLVENPLRLPASRRLHLLGADFAAVARHNLVTGLLLAVLPAVAGASVLFVIHGKIPLRAVSGSVLLVAGVLLLRQGAPAGGILDRIAPRGWPRVAVAVAATLAVVVGWFRDGPTTLLAVGSVTFVFAVAVVVRALRHPEEGGLRLEAEAADD